MVYCEIVFIKACLNELAFFAFCGKTLSAYMERKKVVIVSFLFSVLAVFYPVFPLTVQVVRIFASVLVIPYICILRNRRWILVLPIRLFFSYICLPVVFSLSIITLFICIKNIPLKRFSFNDNYYPCTLITGDKKVSAVGFFDTGNQLRFGGEPVVLCDGKVYDRLEKTNEEEVEFRTVSGYGCARCTDGKVVVRDGNNNFEYKVKVALSPQKLYGCGLILNGDMKGGTK